MIKTTQLQKKFGDFCALDQISCTIGEGCIYGMVGSNGAGKSTFLRILTGIYQPDSGSVDNTAPAKIRLLTTCFLLM